MKKTFTKENLPELFNLLATGEKIEFEEGALYYIGCDPICLEDYIFKVVVFDEYENSNEFYTEKLTLKTKHKATVAEWIIWASSADALGWVVGDYTLYNPPQSAEYREFCDIDQCRRAKIENGKIGEFEYFWIEE